jgi:ribosomal protein S27E
MPYEMRALDVKIFEVGTIRFSSNPKSRHSRIARPIIFSSTQISAIIRPSFANSRSSVYRLNETMFFDNLPLEITCSKCGKQINETVNWLKAESRKCPFCGTLIDTTEFRRGIDEATNRTHEMLQNLQESLRSIKIKIKL